MGNAEIKILESIQPYCNAFVHGGSGGWCRCMVDVVGSGAACWQCRVMVMMHGGGGGR